MSEFFVWDFNLFIALNLVGAAAWYSWAVRRVRQRDSRSRWPAAYSACFYSGVVLLAIAYLGPLAAWSHTFFWVHMTQHLLVMMAAAPLLVLGSPVTLAFRASNGSTRRTLIVPILRSRAVRILTNPALTWALFASVLLGTHFTGFYDWALTNHDAGMFIEQPLFLITALLYYFPILGSNLQADRPSPAIRLISMSLMMIPEAIVGAVIYFSSVVLYPSFAKERPFGLDPLEDQQLAGALMWALVMIVDAAWMMVVAAEWFTSEERRGRRVDAMISAEEEAAAQEQAVS
jgi:cytochrome c oxidase assembly factor CtaG